MLFAAIHLHRERTAVRMAQGRLERFGQALLHLRPHLEAVDHDFDRVLLALRELGQIVDVVYFTVDAQPHEALCPQVLEQIVLLALASDQQRREDHEARVRRQLQDVVHHL